MQMTVLPGGNYEQIPVGTYQARLLSYKPMPPNPSHKNPKEQLAWEFEITEGQYRGQKISRWTDCEPRQFNSLGEMLAQLNGGPLTPGQPVSPDLFVGRVYTVLVKFGKNGQKTYVNAVLPAAGPGLHPQPGNGRQPAAPGWATADQIAEMKRLQVQVFPQTMTTDERAGLLRDAGVPVNANRLTAAQADAIIGVLEQRLGVGASVGDADEGDDSGIPF